MDIKILRTLEEKVDLRHAAVLVIDMQNAFLADGEFLDRMGGNARAAREMVPSLLQFLESARHYAVTIVHVRAVYDPVYMNEPMHERLARHGMAPYCVSGTPGVEFFPGCEPRPGELVVTKHRFDAFYDTELNIVLRGLGIKTLIMCGVATSGCVESTARHAYFHGYYVVLVSDCTAGSSDLRRRATFEAMEHSFGVVASSAEIVHAWQVTRGEASY